MWVCERQREEESGRGGEGQIGSGNTPSEDPHLCAKASGSYPPYALATLNF